MLKQPKIRQKQGTVGIKAICKNIPGQKPSPDLKIEKKGKREEFPSSLRNGKASRSNRGKKKERNYSQVIVRRQKFRKASQIKMETQKFRNSSSVMLGAGTIPQKTNSQVKSGKIVPHPLSLWEHFLRCCHCGRKTNH